MAELILGAQTYAIAPFRLRELRRAAPFIDRLGARAGRLASVEAVAETAADMVEVLAAGMAEGAREALQAQVGLGDLDRLREAFDQVMAEAGLKRPSDEPSPPGEAAAATASVP